MKNTLTVIGVGILLMLLAIPSFAYALATVEGTGTISVDWTQDGNLFSWSTDPQQVIYGMNGADAVSYFEEGGIHSVVDSTSDYSSPYWVSSLAAVADTSDASLGGVSTGFAETTTSSVYSSGTVSNDGEGIILNASGTSHLVRSFTVASVGTFAFEVDYSFSNPVSTDTAGEWTDWYHFAELILRYDDDQNTEVEIIDEIKFGASNPTDLSGILSVFDDWVIGREYSIELHTYNSATAYSPASNPEPVPEPATLFLLGCGLLGLMWHRKRDKRIG